MTLIQITAGVILWALSPGAIFPGPVAMGEAIKKLWFEYALGREIISSMLTNFLALAISLTISLLLAYSTVMPFFRPIVRFGETFRFIGLSGISTIFIVYFGGGMTLKLCILTFAVSSYLLTALTRIKKTITRAEKDYFRTLGMTEWQVVYATLIRGRAAEMWDALRQTSAMGWMMLTAVEGLAKSDGGAGTLLLFCERIRWLPGVYAIQTILWLLGLSQDFLFYKAKRKFFKWADRRTEEEEE
jgi:ABC-type nitrate/sulfonate/bicarbonate transport system permease component